ncbi:hypothetical protein RRG08_018758 [Elysia crispata]|uniref:Uncharacterized protein n=1 Tax=Elysia crispata TaxID=231223 RepID=A0AAE1EBA1_9GAST|nr:hypothetical protein RRG08_018758 [Elysia crispata]
MEKSGFTAVYERVIFLTVRDAVLAAEEDKRKRQHPIPEDAGTVSSRASHPLKIAAGATDPLLTIQDESEEEAEDDEDEEKEAGATTPLGQVRNSWIHSEEC